MGLGHQLAESSKACMPGLLESSGLAESLGKGWSGIQRKRRTKKRRGSSVKPAVARERLWRRTRRREMGRLDKTKQYKAKSLEWLAV